MFARLLLLFLMSLLLAHGQGIRLTARVVSDCDMSDCDIHNENENGEPCESGLIQTAAQRACEFFFGTLEPIEGACKAEDDCDGDESSLVQGGGRGKGGWRDPSLVLSVEDDEEQDPALDAVKDAKTGDNSADKPKYKDIQQHEEDTYIQPVITVQMKDGKIADSSVVALTSMLGYYNDWSRQLIDDLTVKDAAEAPFAGMGGLKVLKVSHEKDGDDFKPVATRDDLNKLCEGSSCKRVKLTAVVHLEIKRHTKWTVAQRLFAEGDTTTNELPNPDVVSWWKPGMKVISHNGVKVADNNLQNLWADSDTSAFGSARWFTKQRGVHKIAVALPSQEEFVFDLFWIRHGESKQNEYGELSNLVRNPYKWSLANVRGPEAQWEAGLGDAELVKSGQDDGDNIDRVLYLMARKQPGRRYIKQEEARQSALAFVRALESGTAFIASSPLRRAFETIVRALQAYWESGQEFQLTEVHPLSKEAIAVAAFAAAVRVETDPEVAAGFVSETMTIELPELVAEKAADVAALTITDFKYENSHDWLPVNKETDWQRVRYVKLSNHVIRNLYLTEASKNADCDRLRTVKAFMDWLSKLKADVGRPDLIDSDQHHELWSLNPQQRGHSGNGDYFRSSKTIEKDRIKVFLHVQESVKDAERAMRQRWKWGLVKSSDDSLDPTLPSASAVANGHSLTARVFQAELGYGKGDSKMANGAVVMTRLVKVHETTRISITKFPKDARHESATFTKTPVFADIVSIDVMKMQIKFLSGNTMWIEDFDQMDFTIIRHMFEIRKQVEVIRGFSKTGPSWPWEQQTRNEEKTPKDKDQMVMPHEYEENFKEQLKQTGLL